MRAVIWFILLFLAAVVAASTFGTNDGLVSIYWGKYRTDISLNLFLLACIVTCFAVLTLIQAMNALVGLPKRAHEWRIARRDRMAQAALRASLVQYFSGRYSRAHKAAERALVIQSETPDLAQDHEFTVLGNLLAACSLHKLQDRPQRDQRLQAALELSGRSAQVRSAREGATLLAAEWALDDRDAPRALELLASLPAGVARRTHALRLKLQGTRLSEQALEALKTARLLAKHQGFSRLAALSLLRTLAIESLDTARDADQVRRIWLGLETADRRDPLIAAHASHCMARHGAYADARACLSPFWERLSDLTEDERAEVALALVPALQGLGTDWLPRLEAAYSDYPREASICFAVGCALAERHLWGKAKSMLEHAAADPTLNPSSRRQAWVTLAHLAEQNNDRDQAAQCYQTAARLLA